MEREIDAWSAWKNDMEQAYELTSSGLANGALDLSVVVVTVVVVTSKLAKSAALIVYVLRFVRLIRLDFAISGRAIRGLRNHSGCFHH